MELAVVGLYHVAYVGLFHVACAIFLPPPVEVQDPNHWTAREFLTDQLLLLSIA